MVLVLLVMILDVMLSVVRLCKVLVVDILGGLMKVSSLI